MRDVNCFGLPYSLEEFCQQTGRAGRDRKPSKAVLMWDKEREQFKLRHTPHRQRLQDLEAVIAFASTSHVCRQMFMFRHLDTCGEIECGYVCRRMRTLRYLQRN